MISKRKGLINLIFLVLLFSTTMYFLFRGQDLKLLIKYIQGADIRYCIPAILCVVFFIGSEALIIFYLLNSIRHKATLMNCLHYSFVGFFFSSITPSATGGQPAQIYCMKKDKIPMSLATLVLLIVTITYKTVLVVLGGAVLIIQPTQIMQYLQPILGVCYLGLALNVICVIFMLLLVFHQNMAKHLLTGTIKLMSKLKIIKNLDKYLLKIERMMGQYKDIAQYFKTNKSVVWNVLLVTIVQRILLFYVTYLTYRSFGLNKIDGLTIVVLQGMISVAVDMLPLPGGMGISEKLFLLIFTPVFGSLTIPGLVISRGISYYSQLLISAVLAMLIYTFIRKEQEGKLEL